VAAAPPGDAWPELPDRRFFRIGEAASLVGVKPHVLRYWETEFPDLRPQKTRSGQRVYQRKDIETLRLIRELLHGQRFTHEGARKHLRARGKGAAGKAPSEASPTAAKPPTPAAKAKLKKLAGEVERLRAELDDSRHAAALLRRDLEDRQRAAENVRQTTDGRKADVLREVRRRVEAIAELAAAAPPN